MTTTVKSVVESGPRIGYALIRTPFLNTTTQVMTTVRGLKAIAAQARWDQSIEGVCLTRTVKLSPPRFKETRIVLAKLELLRDEADQLGLDSASLNLALVRGIAAHQRNELVRRFKKRGRDGNE